MRRRNQNRQLQDDEFATLCVCLAIFLLLIALMV